MMFNEDLTIEQRDFLDKLSDLLDDIMVEEELEEQHRECVFEKDTQANITKDGEILV